MFPSLALLLVLGLKVWASQDCEEVWLELSSECREVDCDQCQTLTRQAVMPLVFRGPLAASWAGLSPTTASSSFALDTSLLVKVSMSFTLSFGGQCAEGC